MKSIICFFCLLAAIPLLAVADDKLVSYDAATSIITVDRAGLLKTYRVKSITEFTVNGVKTTFDKLVPGMKLNISLSDPQTVSRIAVQAAQLPKSNGRSIVIKMRVDGDDIVRVRDGQLTIEHGGWGHPAAIFINGIEWKPTWNGNTTEPFKAFDPPLIPFGQTKPSFKQVSGRSKVAMDKMQGGEFEKILALHFNDGDVGADVYEVHVSW